MRPGRGRPLRLLLALGLLGPAWACVDGVTPDCSDAAAQCGPSQDASFDAGDAATDVARDTSSPDTFVPDAAEGGDLDAGDEI
ncbi:MAG TPA: hypothetical protein VLT33_32425 [Labilithrix sp.]|nr:hypothetical protein [Labilithrix sp.]